MFPFRSAGCLFLPKLVLLLLLMLAAGCEVRVVGAAHSSVVVCIFWPIRACGDWCSEGSLCVRFPFVCYFIFNPLSFSPHRMVHVEIGFGGIGDVRDCRLGS
ncbi:hypothetical protein VPH35_101541 [Triticum aestivum]